MCFYPHQRSSSCRGLELQAVFVLKEHGCGHSYKDCFYVLETGCTIFTHFSFVELQSSLCTLLINATTIRLTRLTLRESMLLNFNSS